MAVFLIAGCRSAPETTPATPAPTTATSAYCIDCHTKKGRLERLVSLDRQAPATVVYGNPAPQVPLADRLLVDPAFLTTTHGKIPCQACHNGESSPDPAVAHQGLLRDPSLEGVDVCAACHKDVVVKYQDSLHNTLQGQTLALQSRSLDGVLAPGLASYAEQNCDTCHTTCGQCHVSRPNVGKGGLLQGHLFIKQPPVQQTCTQCHGANADGEGYYGSDGGSGDVHWTKARMDCTACHERAELHGEGGVYNRGQEVLEAPQCTDCHAVNQLNQRPEHFIHGQKVSCYVCHSPAPASSCADCHVAPGGAVLTYQEAPVFKIGLNTEPDDRHPYRYVVVRHVPVVEDTFDDVGGSLAEFDQVPTWKRTAPHNIQRSTPQTRTCTSCHGNKQLFLTEDDLQAGDSRADRGVVVPVLPPAF